MLLEGDRRGAAPAGAAARAAPEGVGADGGARRLHQRRQDDAVQPADARDAEAVERAVRHAGSARAARAPARPPRAARVRHGRFHRSPAAHAGRRVSRDARGSRRSRSRRCTSSTPRAPSASGTSPRCAACSRRSAPARCRALDVYNKCDSLDEGERGRLRAVSTPGALCISALTGDGRDNLIAAMEARLALDTAAVSR